MEKKDKMIIIISSVFLCVLAFILFLVIQNKNKLNSNNKNNENNTVLGDYVCEAWFVTQDWSGWTSTYINGQTSPPSNSDTSGNTYYT